MNDRCYIYGLRGAGITSRYFYVGSTKHSLEWRWRKHKEHLAHGLNRNPHFARMVKLIGVENVRVELIEEVECGRRFEREEYWIKSLPGLTNIVKNPSVPISQGISADQVERKWLSVRDLIDPRLREATERYVEASLSALRAIEQELIRREMPLEFAA